MSARKGFPYRVVRDFPDHVYPFLCSVLDQRMPFALSCNLLEHTHSISTFPEISYYACIAHLEYNEYPCQIELDVLVSSPLCLSPSRWIVKQSYKR